MLKIPYVLIKTLINIYISVFVAPLQIVFGAIAPNIGFGAWLKNLIANLLVFPMTGILFFLAYLLLAYSYLVAVDVGLERNVIIEFFRNFGINAEGIISGNVWSPPFLGSGAEITSIIFSLMSFGMIVAIPKAADIVKAVVMGEKFAFGSAIGEAIAPLKWGYRASGASLAMEMGQAQSAAGILYRVAGKDRPLYGLMKKLNKNWDNALTNIQTKAGIGAD